MGVYNSPWQGDHFNHEAAEADYTSFCREDNAAYDAMPGNVDEAKQNAYMAPSKEVYISRALCKPASTPSANG